MRLYRLLAAESVAPSGLIKFVDENGSEITLQEWLPLHFKALQDARADRD